VFVFIEFEEALIQKLETKFLAHGVMDVHEMCISSSSSRWNVMHHLPNTFRLLKQHFVICEPTRWMNKI
jgi:Xaa-Pro aminopeptidase